MTSYVENETMIQFDFDIEALVEMLLLAVLSEEKCPYESQVNMLITDNEGIREYNRQYRRIDSATDVLSFPMIAFESEADFSVVDGKEADYFEPESGELVLGDIIISADRVKEQAKQFGHSEKREFAFLTVHSLLHMCGYDHMEKEKARIMEDKQEEILRKLGITREI